MASETGWAAAENLAPTPGGYDLRPLSTGEVLDRTFQLYRSRFALFASLAALPAAVQFAGGTVQVLTLRTEQVIRNGRPFTVATHPLLPAIIMLATWLAFFAVFGITQAATTWAVAEIYLGRAASVRAAWRTATADWFRYVRVVLRQYWSVLWLPAVGSVLLGATLLVPGLAFKVSVGTAAGVLLFGSLFYAVYAGIRVSLGIPAAVVEQLKANAAVRRSMALLTERKVRIFLMWLLLLAMGIIVSIVLAPLQILAFRSQGAERHLFQMLNLAGTFLSSLLVGPVGAIGMCLFYFDERVRHEGFDIEFLMQQAGGAAARAENAVAEGGTSPEPV